MKNDFELVENEREREIEELERNEINAKRREFLGFDVSASGRIDGLQSFRAKGVVKYRDHIHTDIVSRVPDCTLREYCKYARG